MHDFEHCDRVFAKKRSTVQPGMETKPGEVGVRASEDRGVGKRASKSPCAKSRELAKMLVFRFTSMLTYTQHSLFASYIRNISYVVHFSVELVARNYFCASALNYLYDLRSSFSNNLNVETRQALPFQHNQHRQHINT